jgi:hypothetical protein
MLLEQKRNKCLGSMSKRYLDGWEARALLLAVGEYRRACTRAPGKMPVPDTTYGATVG